MPLLGLRGLRAVLKCGCKGRIFISEKLDIAKKNVMLIWRPRSRSISLTSFND